MLEVLEREPLDACRQQLLQTCCACAVEQVSLRKHSAAAGSPGPAASTFRQALERLGSSTGKTVRARDAAPMGRQRR